MDGGEYNTFIHSAQSEGVFFLFLCPKNVYSSPQKIAFTNGIYDISYFINDVFENVTVGKSVIITTIKGVKKEKFIYRTFFNKITFDDTLITHSAVLNDTFVRFIEISNIEERSLIMKVRNNSNIINEFCDVYDGINPGSKELKKIFFSNKFIDGNSKKVIDGKNFERYSVINWESLYIYYCKEFADEIKEQYNRNNKQFTARIIKKNDFFNHQKIVTRQTADCIIGTIDNQNYYTKNSVHSTLIKKQFQNTLEIKFVLALLNSKLISWIYQYEANETGRIFPQVKIERLRNLPFRFSTNQQPIITLVNQILEAKQENPQADTSELENEIDQLVYQLYGLTEEEIAVVEGR